MVVAKASVRTPEDIDRVGAGLFLPCTDLAQDAKMDSLSRSICAAAGGVWASQRAKMDSIFATQLTRRMPVGDAERAAQAGAVAKTVCQRNIEQRARAILEDVLPSAIEPGAPNQAARRRSESREPHVERSS
jgi:hypothetical protein